MVGGEGGCGGGVGEGLDGGEGQWGGGGAIEAILFSGCGRSVVDAGGRLGGGGDAPEKVVCEREEEGYGEAEEGVFVEEEEDLGGGLHVPWPLWRGREGS